MAGMTVDNLDIEIYKQYAMRTEFVEQVTKQYHLTEAAHIPPHTVVIQQTPMLTQLDLLLGVVTLLTPWAHFLPPKKFTSRRKSSFSFSKITPSLGSTDKQESDSLKLEQFPCSSYAEKEERNILKKCLDNIRNLNDMLGFVIGKMGQFLQG